MTDDRCQAHLQHKELLLWLTIALVLLYRHYTVSGLLVIPPCTPVQPLAYDGMLTPLLCSDQSHK
jgi:hypothetical protein